MNSATFIAVLTTVLVTVQGKAIFEIRLIKFVNVEAKTASGECCESYSKGPCSGNEARCDHEFTLCLDSVTSSFPRDDADKCLYKRSASGDITQNSITFGGNINGMLNPIRFRFGVSWPGAIRVKVRVIDNDVFFHDLVDLFVNDWYMNPDGQVRKVRVKGTAPIDTSLEYEMIVRCDPSYYGPNCTQQCVPMDGANGHYTCDSHTGYKVCLSGYKGNSSNCITPSPCSKARQPCLNGGSCIDQKNNTNFTCSCLPGYSGRNCEIFTTPKPTVCDSRPCQHGTCVLTPEGALPFRCDCADGYNGDLCQNVAAQTSTSGQILSTVAVQTINTTVAP